LDEIRRCVERMAEIFELCESFLHDNLENKP
jgi:hypothetical protein